MLLIVFSLPLIAALVAAACNRVVPTRWLAMVAAGVLVATGAALLVAQTQAGLNLPLLTWQSINGAAINLTLRFDQASWAVGLALLAGGALALGALGASLAPTLRGFGGLVAALVLVVWAALAGLALHDLLLPVPWALVTLFSFAALRASGATGDPERLPLSLLAGLAGTVLLIGATLLARATPLSGAVLLAWLVVAMLALGLAPFSAALDDLAGAPASVAALLLPLGLPLLGGVVLLRLVQTAPTALDTWRVPLLVLALLALAASVAAALAAQRLRPLLAWQFSAQASLLLVLATLPGSGPLLAANLIHIMLVSVAGYLAAAVIEGRTGSDNLAELLPQAGLGVVGLTLLISGASALGVPGTWGFWLRLQLFDQLQLVAPWAVVLLLALSGLLALSYLAALLACWRVAPGAPPARATGWAHLAAAAPLLVFGVVPQAAGWLVGAMVGVAGTPGMALAGLAALALLSAPLLLRRVSVRRVVTDPELPPGGVPLPVALGTSLRPVAWLALPGQVFSGLWAALLWLSTQLRRVLALFEQRYYLAGLMIALVLVILFML